VKISSPAAGLGNVDLCGILVSGQSHLWFKDIIEDLLPYLCDIVNKSLSTGSVAGLDPEILKKYRPVTNELFISKLTEKIVDIRIFDHITINSLHSKYQHGYKKFHGTETITLKLVNDVLIVFESNSVTIVFILSPPLSFEVFSDINKIMCLLTKKTHWIVSSYSYQ